MDQNQRIDPSIDAETVLLDADGNVIDTSNQDVQRDNTPEISEEQLAQITEEFRKDHPDLNEKIVSAVQDAVIRHAKETGQTDGVINLHGIFSDVFKRLNPDADANHPFLQELAQAQKAQEAEALANVKDKIEPVMSAEQAKAAPASAAGSTLATGTDKKDKVSKEELERKSYFLQILEAIINAIVNLIRRIINALMGRSNVQGQVLAQQIDNASADKRQDPTLNDAIANDFKDGAKKDQQGAAKDSEGAAKDQLEVQSEKIKESVTTGELRIIKGSGGWEYVMDPQLQSQVNSESRKLLGLGMSPENLEERISGLARMMTDAYIANGFAHAPDLKEICEVAMRDVNRLTEQGRQVREKIDGIVNDMNYSQIKAIHSIDVGALNAVNLRDVYSELAKTGQRNDAALTSALSRVKTYSRSYMDANSIQKFNDKCLKDYAQIIGLQAQLQNINGSLQKIKDNVNYGFNPKSATDHESLKSFNDLLAQIKVDINQTMADNSSPNALALTVADDGDAEDNQYPVPKM